MLRPLTPQVNIRISEVLAKLANFVDKACSYGQASQTFLDKNLLLAGRAKIEMKLENFEAVKTLENWAKFRLHFFNRFDHFLHGAKLQDVSERNATQLFSGAARISYWRGKKRMGSGAGEKEWGLGKFSLGPRSLLWL